MVDLNELEWLACAATPGPWKAIDAPGAGLEIYADVPSQLGMPSRQWPAFSTANSDVKENCVAYETWVQFPSKKLDSIQAWNAVFIAAANPSVVLELIRRLRSAEEKLTDLEKQEPFGYFKAEPFGWTDCDENDEGAIPMYAAPLVSNDDF